MDDVIIVNCFKNPDRIINLDLAQINSKDKLIIYNNDDFEISDKNNDLNKYYFNCISKQTSNSKIGILIFKNINIDLSNTNIDLKSLQKISLKNSILLIQENTKIFDFEKLDSITIKGDLENIKTNLLNFKESNIIKKIKEITLKIFPKSSKVNIFKLLNLLNTNLSNFNIILNIHFKGILSDLVKNKEKINNEIFSKIKKFYLFSLNKVSKETAMILRDELIDKMNNLDELYLNENIECNLENKLKLISIINNCDDININFNLYNINKLKKINLSICDYDKNKSELILYGEANMSFYHPNNKELLLNIINNNHKGNLISLSLCNFDLENIYYLNDILEKSINSVEKLFLRNLNINEEFIDILKAKNLFNCYKISIENIIFNDDEVEDNFFKLINNYNSIKSLKMISLENFTKYSDLLSNSNLENLYLEEIYDINYADLKDILINKRKKNLAKLSFINLEINDEKDKNDFIDIIIKNKSDIKKLKLVGENFNFIYKEIQDRKIGFSNLQKLILNIDKEMNADNEKNIFISKDEDKISFLEKNKNFLNYKLIEKIDLQMFNITFQNKKKIFEIYINLKEIC